MQNPKTPPTSLHAIADPGFSIISPQVAPPEDLRPCVPNHARAIFLGSGAPLGGGFEPLRVPTGDDGTWVSMGLLDRCRSGQGWVEGWGPM